MMEFRTIEHPEYPGPAEEAIIDGKLIAAYGVTKVGDGVGQVWFESKGFTKYARPILRRLKKHIKEQSNNYRRIQATPLSSRSDDHRMFEFLGFVPEGILKDWLPEGDVWMYRYGE